MKNNYSISLFWDARVMNKSTKQSRVLLTINLNGAQFRISIKINCTKSDFDKATLPVNKSIPDDIKVLKTNMNSFVVKAENIINRIPSIDKDQFKVLFKSESDLLSATSSTIDLFYFFENKLASMLVENRVGSYGYYSDCLKSLKRYKSEIFVEHINERWLKGYQLFLKSNNNSSATIAARIRGLRTIYNMAVSQGFISDVNKPFKNIQTSSSIKSKSVLYPIQLKALWEYQPIGIRESRAKAYFFFLYLANGMNPKDMAYLKYSNIKNDTIVFIREKTKYTKSDAQEITVHLNDELKQIIADWGNKDKSGYLFPILNGKTVFEMEKTRNRIKRVCNKSLSIIGKQLGFDVPICLNLARHSFATAHKIMGTPISFISDAMGHSSSQMTDVYMKSLPSENIKMLSSRLLSFDTMTA